MTQLSPLAGNAVIYPTFALILLTGLYYARRNCSRTGSLACNGTQSAIPLALNFVAATMGCGIFATYGEIGARAGIHGVLAYALSSSVPLIGFALIGPIVRKKCPDGFVLTQWVKQRYGTLAATYLSFCTVFTMFLLMIGELAALQSCVTSLTRLDPTAAMITQVCVTTIYTFVGGFEVSFMTDKLQGAFGVALVLVCALGMTRYIDVDQQSIAKSGLLKPSVLGWQLSYILPVAIITNDCFLAGLWIRTFASRSNTDLLQGATIASIVIFLILVAVGTAGMAAVWLGLVPANSNDASSAFFALVSDMPPWVSVVILLVSTSLSTCVFDSLQLAMTSTILNDIFHSHNRNGRVRVLVLLITALTIAVALYASADVMQVYLIADLVSAASIPSILMGLNDTYFWWIGGADVVCGGLGGLVSVWVCGWWYYGSARAGLRLVVIAQGLYDLSDWGPLGAFVAAPVGGLLLTAMCCGIRRVWTRSPRRNYSALTGEEPRLEGS